MGAAAICSCYCLHDDSTFLEASIKSYLPAGPVLAFISKMAWDGSAGQWEESAKIAAETGAEVMIGNWASEEEHRAAALSEANKRGFEFALIPDGDEVIEERLLGALLKVAEGDLADRVYVEWDTYWKSAEYVIRPRERFTPLLLVKILAIRNLAKRDFDGGRSLFLGAEHGLVHHLSYAGSDERIKRKITTWSHRHELVADWFERVWKVWDENRTLTNLHPTHASAYGFAERIRPPAELKDIPTITKETIERPATWPSVSVVIPVYGGKEDLEVCLDSLDRLRELLHEVIVVDNASPDGAATVAKRKGIRLLKNKSNRGFAAACNQGLAASSGQVILFLNSDTAMPRAGLIRLIESLMASGAVAASGPLSNRCGHQQQTPSTYTSLGTLDLFAEDFAAREAEDIEVDMLVGIALAVKRSVLDELGPFDERFGLGTFEDNDLSYRMRRAGYKLLISARSFVHHEGSKTLSRPEFDPQDLLRENHQKYLEKWREDLESGFASGLAGLSPERIQFDPERKPELLAKRILSLVKQADISLCMIVRNEERVLAACLQSAKPFFKQIVIVDTGSSDRTIEIAKEYGAEVYEIPWPDSFAAARNESLQYARGKWIFWMDADDTLPARSGEAILNAAVHAPASINGFVIPVQFVEEGPGCGTRVDHVKLFRNVTGLRFEGRIHEQIVPSLRLGGGEIARLEAVVLHSGYDTSPQGQASKRERDEKLLMLDLAERPDHPFVLFNIGMTAHFTGEHESAINWLEKCIAHSGPEESHLRKAYALLAVSERELGRAEEALAILEKGLAVVGQDPELHFHSGLLLTQLGRYPEAKDHYLAVGEDISSHFSSVDIGILGCKRWFNLGALCRLMDDYSGANHWFSHSLERQPGFLPCAFELFDAALATRDDRTGLKMLEHVEHHQGRDLSWAKMGERYWEVVGGPEQALAFLREAAGRDAEIGLLLARRLLQMERQEEAMPHLLALDAAGSAEAAFLLGVAAIRAGDFKEALRRMESALERNPGHEDTVQQILRLKAALSVE